jgi:glycosyltransferase involved in cell wall biosynthesis
MGASSMLINGRFLTRPATGVDRFANELLRSLMLIGSGARARVLVPDAAALVGQLPKGLALERAGSGAGQRWEQLALPRLARDEPLINLCNTAPLFRENQLVVVHDAATLANPQNFSLTFRSWYRFMLGALTRRTRVLASVSRFSANELTRFFGVRARGVEVVSEGGEHILREPPDTSVIDKFGLSGRRFVLALGSASPNKNLAAIVQAMHLLDEPDLLLVAAGGGNSRVFSEASVSDPRLVATGYVTDAQVRALYEHAACFAFPSFYEGFGLPPLEAMCCGCPVVVSDRASLPEVCGDAALYCDPDDPATLAAQLRRVLGSESARQDLRAAGRERAALFTWDRAARQFSDIVRANFQ